MANYFNTFNGFAVATGLPAGFTNRWFTTATFSTVDAGAGDIAVRQAVTTNNHIGISMDAVDGDANRANGEVLLRVRSSILTSSNTYNGAFCRGSGAAGSHTMYVATLFGGQLELVKFVAGVYTQVAATTSIINSGGETSAFANTWYWIRLQYFGTALKVRIWKDGAAEPGTWDIQVTDGSITAAGWGGKFAYTVATMDYGDIAISTNSEAASMSGGGGGGGPGLEIPRNLFVSQAAGRASNF